ncbi:GNAT family N-acetyltransferase [Colwelliaceae bacterium 6471]
MYDIENQSPSVDEFVQLREKIGWGTTNMAMAQASLEHSLFHVTVCHDSQLIGMGRVIGDGFMYFYIQDVVIDPSYQGQGIGRIIMDNIENYLAKAAKKGATIGLLAAQGKEGFYQKHGYVERTGAPLGNGMCKFI